MALPIEIWAVTTSMNGTVRLRSGGPPVALRLWATRSPCRPFEPLFSEEMIKDGLNFIPSLEMGGLGDGRRATRRPMGTHCPATAPAQTTWSPAGRRSAHDQWHPLGLALRCQVARPPQGVWHSFYLPPPSPGVARPGGLGAGLPSLVP